MSGWVQARNVALWLACLAVLGCGAQGKPDAPSSAQRVLRINGEVYARETAALMPPSVDDMWNFNITLLAPDGGLVKKGEPVLVFDSSELAKRLVEKQSLLKEKQTQREKLELELAERGRNETLATAEAVSLAEKAARKAEQPQEYVAGVQYRKLVVEREKTRRRMELLRRREVLAATQRREERRLLESEVAQLQGDLEVIQRSLGALQVVAPRDGLMMHKSSWSGEKFDVGSQVWRGQGVAEIPDTDTLAVRAELPERELLRVRVGMPVKVVVEGGAGSVVRGRVEGLGQTVRSKSRAQPEPVVDVEVLLDGPGTKLRPGQPVSVELDLGGARS